MWIKLSLRSGQLQKGRRGSYQLIAPCNSYEHMPGLPPSWAIREGDVVVFNGLQDEQRAYQFWHGSWNPLDWEPESGPGMPTEPSSMDKALEEFSRKREARRQEPHFDQPMTKAQFDAKIAESARASAIGRAMQKLIPAEMDFRSQLVNVKVQQ